MEVYEHIFETTNNGAWLNYDSIKGNGGNFKIVIAYTIKRFNERTQIEINLYYD